MRHPRPVTAGRVVWCPTANGTSLAGVSVPLPEGVAHARAVKLAAGGAAGIESPLAASAGRVELAVDETPTIVLLDR